MAISPRCPILSRMLRPDMIRMIFSETRYKRSGSAATRGCFSGSPSNSGISRKKPISLFISMKLNVLALRMSAAVDRKRRRIRNMIESNRNVWLYGPPWLEERLVDVESFLRGRKLEVAFDIRAWSPALPIVADVRLSERFVEPKLGD
jgi:hypothetical protein